MRRSPRTYARALLALLRDAPAGRRSGILRGFWQLLRRRRHLKLLPRIIEAVADERRRAQGVVRVFAETARPLPTTYASTLARKLGQPIEFTARVKRSLVGGIRLTIGERRIDASIPTMLRELERRLRG